MCIDFGGGGGGSGSNDTLAYQQQQDKEARAREDARVARIALGRKQIDAMFDRGQTLVAGTGTTRDVPNPAAANWVAPTGKQGTIWATEDHTTMSPLDGTTPTAAESTPPPATISENVPEEWANTGTAFDQAFYDKRKQAYLDNYLPQLGDQFKKARSDMAYALARSGNSRSSVAAEQYGDLDKKKQIQEATIASDAETDVNNLRGTVEDARTALINDLNTSADPAGAANLALARTQQIAGAPVTYSPLGDVFAGVTSGIGSFVQGVRQAQVINSAGLNAKPVTARSGGSGGVSTGS